MTVKITDRNGRERYGTRQTRNGRKGYYDENGYIPIFHGYKITFNTEKKSTPPQVNTNNTIGTPTRNHQYPVSGGQTSVPPLSAKEESLVSPLENVNRMSLFNGEIINIPGISNTYINIPKNLDQFHKPPRLIVYFPGHYGSIGSANNDVASIMPQVEQMRSSGDPVILIMPQSVSPNDPKGKYWNQFNRQEAFPSLITVVENRVGKPIQPQISCVAFSGGYKGLAKVLRAIEGSELYNRIHTISLLDAAYGEFDVFQRASQRGKELFSIYTPYSGVQAVLSDDTINPRKTIPHLQARNWFQEYARQDRV